MSNLKQEDNIIYEQRNLLFSNPTIGWARKHIADEGAVLIHTDIRPDLSVMSGYEWGTLKLDKEEFEKRLAYVNSVIEQGCIMQPLKDSDLLEELF